jgi:hypothetical protein
MELLQIIQLNDVPAPVGNGSSIDVGIACPGLLPRDKIGAVSFAPRGFRASGPVASVNIANIEGDDWYRTNHGLPVMMAHVGVSGAALQSLDVTIFVTG